MSDIDLQQVLREIDEEVAARRAAGDFPPGMERDLDLIFARFAPATHSADDLDALIEQADRGAFVDVDVPTASRMPAVAYVKRGLRKLMSWYLRYLAQQVSVFASSVVGALKLLGRRVEALEASTPGADPAVRAAWLRASTPPDVGGIAGAVVDELHGVTGRVLVAECGDGALVQALRDAGLDAYGCDPRTAAVAGLDLRTDDVLDHLRAVDHEALGALVLLGVVDRVAVGVQLTLVDRAADVLATGGRVAVVGNAPESWGRTTSVVEADLAPGKPLHAETWSHLLTERGFADVDVRDGEPTYVVAATRQR
ncbi:MAG: hypothetical protein V7636_411 [Actinomycetota bacterium]